MSRPRKGSRANAAQQVAALARGGLDALRAAEEMLRAETQLQVRVSATRKRLYTEAAKRAGMTLSAWILRQLDAAVTSKKGE